MYDDIVLCARLHLLAPETTFWLVAEVTYYLRKNRGLLLEAKNPRKKMTQS